VHVLLLCAVRPFPLVLGVATHQQREGKRPCPASRADALFELTDAILCADHAVTSPVRLSLVPAFRRGHGALYAGPADGRIDEEKLAVLLTGTLPQLVDGEQGRAWIAEHDTIDYGLLERALAGLPAQAAAQVREAYNRGAAVPLVIFDAGYSAAALTAGLAGCPVHLLARLPSGSVFYYDPATWPGKNGRPGKYGLAVHCHKADDLDQANPEPDESLVLPDTPRYGTVQSAPGGACTR
jgi:DDE superfamily endonuclease